MKASGGFGVGCSGLLPVVKKPKVIGNAARLEARRPLTAWHVKAYAANTARPVVPLRVAVGVVFGIVCCPKVFPAIIASLAIDVVNLISRPFSGHVDPCYTRSTITALVGLKLNQPISLADLARDRAGIARIPALRSILPAFPAKKPRLWIVGQRRANELRREMDFIWPALHGGNHTPLSVAMSIARGAP